MKSVSIIQVIGLSALLLAGLSTGYVSTVHADDDAPTPKASTKPSSSGESVMDESQNNRQKTLQGSKSPFSLQFNLTYSGSSIIHPLAQEVPNAGDQIPAPVASLSGTFSGRYRLDPSTTIGLGGGVTVYTPFQGPSNGSVANPYSDIAHTFKIDDIKNRADFQVQVFTDHQNNQNYGYTSAFSLIDEAFYEFKFGLTVGFIVEFDYYTFSGKPQYNAAYKNPGYIVGNSGNLIGLEGASQTQWDMNTDPYFEYALNSTFNLRSVIGIIGNNLRNMPGDLDLNHTPVYQTLGLGTQIGKSVFLYTFLEGFWEELNARSTTVGMNAIINIF